jgi:pimeloyl-ACP methyl ester carboxylesterase
MLRTLEGRMPTLLRPDGCRLHFEIHGPAGRDGQPDGPPLLLLEGMGGDIPGWRRNIPHLARTRRVIGYDFRGNGRSDAPDRPVTMGTFVDDTVALLDHMDVRRADVYGQSFGGMVAQELALTQPSRTRSLVIACTTAGPAHSVAVDPRVKVPKDRPYLALYSEAFARRHPDHVAEDILVGSQNPQPAHAGRRQWEAIQGWSSYARLGDIACPVLVLHGTEDRLVAVGNARVLADRIPGARLVLLEGAGHVYHSEQPEASDAAVLDFLAAVKAEERDG